MIGAFHWVQGGRRTLQKILKDGMIRPASERIDSGTMAAACNLWFGSPAWPPNGEQALVEMINESLRHLKPPAKKLKKTMFECPDLISGDLKLLFFGIGDWPFRLIEDAHHSITEAPQKERDKVVKNGFVFDAERLIRIGGRIRFGDYIDDYQNAMHRLLVAADEPIPVVKEKVRIALAEVQTKELRGEDALDFLRQGQFVWENELVLPGRLQVQTAIEVWQEGKLL